jgi:predicted HAD superfamily phosphohydrolase YqeG
VRNKNILIIIPTPVISASYSLRHLKGIRFASYNWMVLYNSEKHRINQISEKQSVNFIRHEKMNLGEDFGGI